MLLTVGIISFTLGFLTCAILCALGLGEDPYKE